MDRIKHLQQLGQSVWLDFISRSMVRSGHLQHLVRDIGVRGLTSNPSIFEKAIADSPDYNESLLNLLDASPESDAKGVYEALAVEDIQVAAHLLRDIYEESGRVDGMVSLEVSPDAAYDTRATIHEARHLWKGVHRPNAMIKIPATPAGIPAIETCTAEGININATLIFSVEQYEQVARAYIRGLTKATLPSHVTSVASFFVSRIDTAVDKQLDAMDDPRARELLGRTAVANCKIAYRKFREIFTGDEFAEARKHGGRVQRLLFGSTSTKNPAYSDTKYVDELIGRDTVNTMPPQTLEAFNDHGTVRATLEEDINAAAEHLQQLAALGVDLSAVTEQLQRAGVEAFANSYNKLLRVIDQKHRMLQSGEVLR